jgi:ATP-binding cassette, subfamily F, member 3
MSLLSLSNVSKHFGAEQILDDVSLRIERDDHVGLVGSNGAGKSTLLRIIAGVEEADAGTVSRVRGLLVGYLEQVPEFVETETLYEVMLGVFRASIEAQDRIRELETEMAGGNEHETLIEEYGRLQTIVEHAGYDYRSQIERVLTGLGLSEGSWYEPISNLSGGQRTRANLGRTLLQDTDLLLLDEPTNHLDIPAVEWLESYLRDLKRAFVIVAHDRYLLDRVTRRTFELSRRRLIAYDVPYNRYLELRAERVERHQQEYDAQQEQIAKTEDFIRRYGAGQRYKEARGRQKRLDRLERIERPQEESPVHLALKGPTRSGEIVLELRKLVAGYPGKPLIRLPEDVTLRRADHVALVGPNGSGKTTLLRTLVEALPPLEGAIRWGARTSVGYYSQTLEQLDGRRTVLEEIQSTRPLGEEEGRNYLGQFLFSGDDVFKTISVLSGGEKSRVALAKLILEESNVLVLDEPTNHLDIASREALQRVLAGFTGTLLFVSHDRYLIDRLAAELWVVEDGSMKRYSGTYSQYAAGNARPLDADAPHASHAGDSASSSPESRLQTLQNEAEALATRLAEISATTSIGQLTELTERYAEVLGGMRDTEEEWLRSIRKQFRASLA